MNVLNCAINIKKYLINDNNDTNIDEDIKIIRRFLNHYKLEEFNIIKDNLKSVTNSEELSQLYQFGEYNPTEYYNKINRIWNPFIVFLEDQTYLYEIKSIKKKDIESDFYIYSEMEKLEDAFIKGDYAHVNTLSSSILQSTFKFILSEKKVDFKNNDKFPNLIKLVAVTLNLDPKLYTGHRKAQLIASKVNSIALALNDIRNEYSSSHGTDGKKTNITKHHAKLIVDSTKTLVNFYLGVLENKK